MLSRGACGSGIIHLEFDFLFCLLGACIRLEWCHHLLLTRLLELIGNNATDEVRRSAVQSCHQLIQLFLLCQQQLRKQTEKKSSEDQPRRQQK